MAGGPAALVRPQQHRARRVGSLASSAAALRDVAESVGSFLGGAGSPGVFKVVPGGYGEAPGISCDVLEVVDALGFEGEVAVEALREAMDGLSEAHFGRREQARLAVLAAGLLAACAALRARGLAVWALRGALRRTGALAEATLERLSAEHLAAEVLASLPLAAAAPVAEPDSDSDDVGWFFSAAEASPLAQKPVPVVLQPPPRKLSAPDLGIADEQLDDISRELCRRHRAAGQRSRHCFVYTRLRLRAAPLCALEDGVVCHVQREHAVFRAASLRDGHLPPVQRAIFLDADLTDAAYESCAPAARRVPESFALDGAVGSSMLPSVRSAREAGAAAAVERLLESRGVDAIFLAGLASPPVESACRAAGALLVQGLPARLLEALAEEAGAEVLRGLPGGGPLRGERRPPWEAEVELHCELRELSADERRRCAAWPLLGFRQPLLAHQLAVGEDAAGPCWELRARAARGGCASTAVLEAACEPAARRLHAELGDRLFAELRRAEEGAGAQRVPGSGGWLAAVAEALEQAAAVPSTAETGAEPAVAPWLAPPSDGLAEAAALEGLADAFRQASLHEASLVVGPDAADEDLGDERPPAPAPVPELRAAASVVVARALRLAGLLSGLEELG